MTRQITIMLLLGLLVGATSVRADDKEELQTSLAKWQEARRKCDGDYAYKVRWSSFAGYGHETEVIVIDNKVAERRFRTLSNRLEPVRPGAPPLEPAGHQWIEKDKELGTHEEGAPAKTLDELYEDAAKVVERELSENERRYLRFDKQGLLRSCYTIDPRIADDAPINGVVVSGISFTGGSKPDKVYKAPNGKPFPAHWGQPPLRQTRDLRPLPGGYGRGSGTLARWIQLNLNRDAKEKDK